MKRAIQQWPAMVWPLMSLASLYILIGTSGTWKPTAFVVGVALALVTFGLALYLALRPLPGGRGPRERRLLWPMVALGAWYVALAAAAATAGPWYAVAGLFAGVIPLSALALMIAVARRKTVVAEDGTLRDASAGDETDPWPGIGLDDHETVAGDTPQRPDHPQHGAARRFQRKAEREAARDDEAARDQQRNRR
jgi:hypothetical protein